MKWEQLVRAHQHLNAILGYCWHQDVNLNGGTWRFQNPLCLLMGQEERPRKTAIQIHTFIVKINKMQGAEKSHENVSAVDSVGFHLLIRHVRLFLEEWTHLSEKKKEGRQRARGAKISDKLLWADIVGYLDFTCLRHDQESNENHYRENSQKSQYGEYKISAVGKGAKLQ